MKDKLVKIIVLVLVFVAAVSAVIFINRDDKKTSVYAEWNEAGLPVAYLEFEGQKVNCMHGYTMEMDKTYMRDTITPIDQGRTIKLVIDTYGSDVSSISYQVWSLDGKKLYVKKECKDYSESGNIINADISLDDILSKATEYQLIIKLSTAEYKEVNYYTRIRYYDDTNISGIVDYVKNFSAEVISGNLSNDIVFQLESDLAADSSSFGFVNIKSTYNHVGWGDLKPEVSSDILIQIKDYNEMTGSVMLEYDVSALNENDKQTTLRVKEFFSVRYINDTFYLIAYERQADEKFEFTKDIITAEDVELGIISKKKLPLSVYTKGALDVFAVDGELWCFNSTKNSATRIFSFKDSAEDIRTLFDDHEINIVTVDGDGNVQFTVSGYMNRGFHEGKCGIGFYQYTKETNAVNEVFFIESQRPYGVLKEEIGKVSYLGENGLYYLMFAGSLYTVDFSGPEYVKVTEGLTDELYAVDGKNGIVAWQEQKNWYECTSIRQMFLDDNSEYVVTADDGDLLRVLGFIDGDMLIGKAHSSDVVVEGTSVKSFPMYKLEIINKDHEVVANYNGGGYFISDISMENDRIIINREYRDEDGFFVPAEDDVLIKNWEDENLYSKVVSSVLNLRKRVYRLDIGSISVSKDFSSSASEFPASMTNNLSIAASAEDEPDSMYYAYACGSLQGMTSSVSDAINLIYDNMGVVVDCGMNYIWTRANRQVGKTINVPTEFAAADEDATIAACVNTILNIEEKRTNAVRELENGKSAYDILNGSLENGALDLRGCLLNQVLYYVNNDSPVIVYTDKNKAELIIGFYSNSQIIMYDTMQQASYTITWQEAEELFAANGNRFLSYVK